MTEPEQIAAVSNEPVAWLYTTKSLRVVYLESRPLWVAKGVWTETPLYAHPPTDPEGSTLAERDATIARLEAALREFLDAARYDPHMDGSSTFMGWKQSDLRRAETRARAALKGTTP